MDYENIALAFNNRDLANNLHAWQRHAAELEAYVKKLEAQRADLNDTVKQRDMHIAGLTAYLDAFKQANPNSPVMADSGKRYKDGDVKTKGALIYEAAHDRKGRESGIANPAARRAD